MMLYLRLFHKQKILKNQQLIGFAACLFDPKAK